MKKALIALAALVLLVLAGVGTVWFMAFSSNRPIVPGHELGPAVETVKDGFVSSVILDVEPGKVALIDSGHDTSAKALLEALRQRGLGPAAVVAIFLTHGHPDHAAGCKMFPGAKIYAMESDVPLIGDVAKVTDFLHDGEVTQIGGLRVETFATPGHTPGSVVFLADNVLFFGDSAGGSKDGKVMSAVRIFTKNPDENLASLKHLRDRLEPRAREIKWLSFAHTGPLPGFAPLDEFAHSH